MRLNPLDDFIFKKLLGEQGSEQELLSFLNAVLIQNDNEKLVSVEIIDNKELSKQLLMDKGSRLDIRAMTSDGSQINIEVQLRNEHNIEKRTLYYWGKLFLDGIQRGDNYQKLTKVVTINLLDFDYLDIDRFHSTYHLWEDNSDDYLLTDLLEIHFIEMPKFRRLKEKQVKTNPLHRWMAFLDKTIDEKELEELIDMDTAIKRAEAKLEFLSSDDDTLALYKARQDAKIEYNSAISFAESKGKLEGRSEEKFDVAQKLLAMRISVDVIVNATGLTVDEIEKLKDKSFN